MYNTRQDYLICQLGKVSFDAHRTKTNTFCRITNAK